MSYVKPETVDSPKGVVRVVEVLYDAGPDADRSWSAADLTWRGNPALGIRWNGEADEPRGVGSPQSRGHATWFIVPEDLEDAVREQVKKLRRKGHDRIAEGYRAMARERDREAEAEAWTEGLIADADDSKG